MLSLQRPPSWFRTRQGTLTHHDSFKINFLVGVAAIVDDRAPFPDVGALGGARLENIGL